jgi:transposase
VIDVTEILTHWYAGRTIAEVARSLGLTRDTVRKYVAPAKAAGMVPGGQPVSPEQWATLVREWFPELVIPELRHPKFAEIAPFDELIRQMVTTNTVATVWQRLRDEHGLAVSQVTFRRYLWTTMPDHDAKRALVTVRKPDPPPGQEAQIDYGYLGRWTDPATGRARRVWAFVMVLSASRHLFVRPVLQMSLAAWVDAHVAAFGFFGGAPRRLVVDNLKAGVLTPDLYDPKLNRTYAELAHHYGTLIDPARARKPKDKPRVERPVPYVRDSFFAGRAFASLPAMIEAAEAWSLEVAGRRSCRPLGGAQPLAVFQASEQHALQPLPAQPYELAAWSTPKVHPDCHITVEGGLYSVPWRLVGCQVDARATSRLVEVFVDGELVKTHVRTRRGGKQTDWGDFPPEKVAFLQRTPAWCRQRAAELGPGVQAVAGELLAGGALHHLRAVQAILRLHEPYGAERLDAACQRALAAGDPSYRTVKGILAAGLERAPLPEQLTLAGQAAKPAAPALLRGPDALVGHLPAGSQQDPDVSQDGPDRDAGRASAGDAHDPHYPDADDGAAGQDRERLLDQAGQRREADHEQGHQGVAG